MRMMKLALFALAALLLGSASASAITVKKRIEAPGLPPQIWEHAGGFCAIKTWHPAVADCVEGKEGDVVFRMLTHKDGGKIKEKLTGTEDISYSYEIIEVPCPSRITRLSFGWKWMTSRIDWSFIGRPTSTPMARATTKPRKR